MAYTNSPLVAYTKLSPNHSGQRTHAIDRISPHCVVGQCTAEGLGDWFAASSTQASSNYGIDKNGRVGLYVEEKNRSWCTSSNANDQRAITIECASGTSEPYEMNDKVYATLINLCTDICKRNGKKKLLWFADKDKSLNYEPKSDEMVITVHRWFANKSCVPVDTEVLTRAGWVKLHDIQIGDEIACATLDGLRITFEEVLDKVEERRQDTYTSNGLTATKDHRMVYSIHNGKEYRIDFYRNLLRDGNNIYIPTSGYADQEGLPITDSMLELLIAVQADGHYMYDKRADGSKGYYGLEFHLKKERKIHRLCECLDACHLEYRMTNQSDGSVKIRVYNKEGFNIVLDLCEKWLKDKCFTWEWLKLSEKQALFVLNEILFWDGCVAAHNYCSGNQVNLDVISALAAVNGVGSNVTGNCIQFRENPYITLGESKRNNKGANTLVSCVTVKTGIFLCRQNGKTFVIGNCPGNWLYARLGDVAEKVTAALGGSTVEAPASTKGTQATEFKNLSETDAAKKIGELCKKDMAKSGILASVSAAQFILESGYGKSELAQNANNCFGMKCSLSGNTWSGSAWDGKSKYTKKTNEEYTPGTITTITADFRKYPCVEDSVADHSAYLLGAMNGSKKRYAGLAGEKDYKKAIQIIKDGGYATSSTYVEKICSIIERFNLTQYDTATAAPATPATPQNTNFPAVPFTVTVIIDDLNYRSEPSMNGKVNGQTGKGVFTILEVKNGWGRLKSGAGWIYLENPAYCTVNGNVTPATPTAPTTPATPTTTVPYLVRVAIDDLNIRKGPGTSYAKTGKYTGKGTFTIVEEQNGWGRLKSGAGWISLAYTSKV